MKWVLRDLALLGGVIGFIALVYFGLKDQPNCYYVWKDYTGQEGTAYACETYKGNLICYEGNTRHSVVEYTRVCE